MNLKTIRYGAAEAILLNYWHHSNQIDVSWQPDAELMTKAGLIKITVVHHEKINYDLTTRGRQICAQFARQYPSYRKLRRINAKLDHQLVGLEVGGLVCAIVIAITATFHEFLAMAVLILVLLAAVAAFFRINRHSGQELNQLTRIIRAFVSQCNTAVKKFVLNLDHN